MNSSTVPTGATISNAFRAYPNNFLLSGMIGGATPSQRNAYGVYYSSTSRSGDNVARLYYSTDFIYPGTYGYQKQLGQPVRCIAD